LFFVGWFDCGGGGLRVCVLGVGSGYCFGARRMCIRLLASGYADVPQSGHRLASAYLADEAVCASG